MALVVDTIGLITLPTGERSHAIILTGSEAEIRMHAPLWAERVTIAKAGEPCDDCGEARELRETIDDYGRSFGVSHKVCRECYDERPEPDTGRPDWTDL